MMTLTLEPNRSNSPSFAVHVTHERRGNTVQRIERRFRAIKGRWVCTSSRVVPWPRKDWTNAPNGERDKHGNRHTMKRDWLHVHANQEASRLNATGGSR